MTSSHVSTCVLHSGAHHCTAGLMHSWFKKKKKQSLHMKQRYSQAELTRKREKEGIFSSQTVGGVLNNGAGERGHTDAVKGFCCISLIW